MLNLTKQQHTGIAGSIILMLSTFLQAIDLPFFADLSLFELEKLDSLTSAPLEFLPYALMVTAIASIILCLLNYCKALFYTAFLSTLNAGYILYGLYNLKQKADEDIITSFIMEITETTFDINNLKYGWVVLAIGIILLIVSALMKTQPKEGLK